MICNERFSLCSILSLTLFNCCIYCYTGNGRHQLPLFGHFCCRLAAQPNCMTQETYSAFTYVPDAFVKGSSAKDKKSWTKCWTQLVAFKLKFWIKHEHFLENREPDICMSINKVNFWAENRISSNGGWGEGILSLFNFREFIISIINCVVIVDFSYQSWNNGFGLTTGFILKWTHKIYLVEALVSRILVELKKIF